MPSAYIDTPYARVKLRSERLIALVPKTAADPEHVLRELPLREVERLILNEHVQITTEAVAELLRRGAAIHYVDFRGQALGQTLPSPGPDGACRLLQYRQALDPAFGLAVARSIVAAKIHNQCRLLRKADGYRDRCEDSEFERLRGILSQAEAAENLDRLRGFEGAASALYFELWARYLPPDFPFERRSSRPPLNAVNACLSYAASLVYHELTAAAHCCGLDPGLGHLHTTDNTRWSLALDLMEPFRPALAEALILRLFALRMFASEDFEARDGGVYLCGEGRKKLIAEYERRMERSFMSEHAGHRTSLRQQLRGQASAYKAALTEPSAFRPFRFY